MFDAVEEFDMVEPREIFQSAIEQGHLGLAALDADGKYVAVNAALLAMHGLEEGALLGKHWQVTVHPDDRKRATEAYLLAKTAGQSYVEVRALREDNVVVYQALTVTGVTDNRGEFAGYRCLRQNITRYRRDYEALTLAVESAPNGLLILDRRGTIQSANQAIEKLFGYRRDELTGQKVTVLFPALFPAAADPGDRRSQHRGDHRSTFREGRSGH